MQPEQEQRAILEKLIVDNKDLEELEAQISRFNIFEAVGMVRQEIKHSNFIRFLLDPSEKHQLGDLFLKKVLLKALNDMEEVVDGLDIAVANFSDAEIRREWQHIDLLIYSPSNALVCTIENKVDSGEGPNQLQKYQDVIDCEYPGYKKLFVYLTKDGDAASLDNWLSLSYGDIADIIEKICIENHSNLNHDIEISMRHYIELIRRYIMSDSDIAELCRKIYSEHRQAIDLIYEHRPDMRSDIEDYLIKLIQEFAKSAEIEMDSVHGKWIRFTPIEWDALTFQKTCSGWSSSKRILLFEFWNEPQSLRLHLVIGPGDFGVKQSIYEKIRGLNIRGLKRCKIKDSGWHQVCIFSVLDLSDYEGDDLEAIQEKIRALFVNYLDTDMKIIRKTISEAFA